MGETNIEVTLNEWLYNAGVVGFVNIVGKDNVTIVDNSTISFSKDVLLDFEDKYFDYFINTYKKQLPWYKIISYESEMQRYEDNNFDTFDEQALERLNKYIKDTVKKYIKSNSYKAAYQLMNSETDLLALEKKLKPVTTPKKSETFLDEKEFILNEVKERLPILKEIITCCKSKEGRKYLAGKNIIYNQIKNAWNGVCFLNPQTKEKDMYVDFKNHFVVPTEEYFEVDDPKRKYHCFVCDRPVKNLSMDLSFLNQTGFDTNRKSSHVWNFTNDVGICPFCRLIYSCVPAGFTYVYNRGLFVNDSTTVINLLRVNENIKLNTLEQNDTAVRSVNTYYALTKAMQEQFTGKINYELADIQIVRYENECYHFNILSRLALSVLKQSKESTNRLLYTGYREGNVNFNLYELVMEHLFNKVNLFTTIHKLIVYKLSNVPNLYYNISHVNQILEINTNFLRGIGYMEGLVKEEVRKANQFGYYFRKAYKNKGADNKLSGISYKLLNALKTSNINMFMDVLLSCYSYLKQQVPQLFLQVFTSDETFKTIGYAFVAGIIDHKNEEGRESK
ncbi:type I-B CRISPR-associated protein Cas8b1/Cst1 [Sporolactobacillus terrae]|uniref:Type I-B CRISPR-associated protein Cas8b1/Cst1 n=1 Tax=Sporolactobacillus terrae TaxID=269673 RepID=A0ABX5Q5G9_9BACL|nr:type I-B CRISPR-associated protein Cas8b1/Cst1 [Sporolactobacillus terrae]QAA21902.1 type I-B CRISPR-associated protein Cas8b1/Cst1 [Sporolactobacillus terrae]QAA24875.1 type I-B CRISPR-associated protein Cas8b1/Cst1 [Sporolactobacillus terrae]UAK16695.1 type I-B CRISPR-associated protein Cas8b1/Cst1 [Sporolactobacillus terrae]